MLLGRGYDACEIDFEVRFWLDCAFAERVGERWLSDRRLGAVMAWCARDLTPTVGRPPKGLMLPPFPFGLGGAARYLDALVGR